MKIVIVGPGAMGLLLTGLLHKAGAKVSIVDYNHDRASELNRDGIHWEGMDGDISINIPVKMDFRVISSPPGVKGNSAGNVTKQVKIETGALINAPLFINEGDHIKVNTDTGEYVERIK